MWTALLIVHGFLAVLLLGAVTHQAASAAWPSKPGTGRRSFMDRFRGVAGGSYTTVVIVLFVATFILGGVIYPAYRLNVRTYLQDYRMLSAEGAFEIKEHLAAIGLMLLPLYWYLWTRMPVRSVGAAASDSVLDTDDPVAAEKAFAVARAAVTVMIAVAAWSSFFIGHILNNIRGLFGT